MKYLYGDATPFPLDENFIETLSAAADACVDLFHVDRELAARRRQVAVIREQSAAELAYLETLARALEAALAPMLPDGGPAYVAQKTAQRIAQTASSSVEQARSSLIRECDESIKSTLGTDLGGRIMDALKAFLLHHQLPKTQWGIRWAYNLESSQAELTLSAAAPCHLRAKFAGQLPADQRWANPVRISDLDPQVRVSIQRDGSWLARLLKGSQELITGFYITRVEIQGDEARFEVHRQLKRITGGYEIRVRGAGQSSPVIYPLGSDHAGAEPILVSGDDAADLMRLWAAIESDMLELRRHRARLLAASLRDVDVTHIDEPAELAEAILNSVAPIVREMRLRSRVPGELVLKRDLGNGRREELFVPRRFLEQKFADLPYEQQLYFQAAGLGSEATVEFVSRAFPLTVPPSDDLYPVEVTARSEEPELTAGSAAA